MLWHPGEDTGKIKMESSRSYQVSAICYKSSAEIWNLSSKYVPEWLIVLMHDKVPEIYLIGSKISNFTIKLTSCSTLWKCLT